MNEESNPPSIVSEQTLLSQLGEAYGRLPLEIRSHHAELLERIRRTEDVEIFARPEEGSAWTVTVVSSDCVGILSIIAGLFAARRIDILGGDIFTPRIERPAAPEPRGRQRVRQRRPPHTAPTVPTKKILDIFKVRTPEKVDSVYWKGLRNELAGMIAMIASGKPEEAREKIIDEVSQAVGSKRESETHLFPVTVEVENESSPSRTRLYIQSADTLGFLFEFTNALAMLNVDIERVEIRTVGGEARDTFWVREPSGAKISDPERLHELRAAAALIKQFTHLLPRSPNPAQALRQFTALARQMLSRRDWTSELETLESTTVLSTLAELMGVSRFLWEDFLRMQHENLFPVVRDVPSLDGVHSRAQLEARLESQLREIPAGSDPLTRLNRFRDREMFRIDLRHITRRIGFRDFSYELTDLSQAVITQATRLCHEELRQRLGVPAGTGGEPCSWCLCALGKFGGREMGFASDLELIFVYETEGSTDGPQPVSNFQYFQEFVQTFLKTFTLRREGIFEVDLALRPHGQGGSLASSLEGFRRYYSAGGGAQQFERMSLVKLRRVTGDASLENRILEVRDGFVYSGRPLDYEDIRHLRRRQARELAPAGQVNAKFGPGGLVDVEYFVQARQIEAGHQAPRVRVSNTLEAIDRLRQGGHVSPELADKLTTTYGFLRRLIDALRVVRGHARDLNLPPPESRELAYLARRLDYDSPAALGSTLAERMEFARNLWTQAP